MPQVGFQNAFWISSRDQPRKEAQTVLRIPPCKTVRKRPWLTAASEKRQAGRKHVGRNPCSDTALSSVLFALRGLPLYSPGPMVKPLLGRRQMRYNYTSPSHSSGPPGVEPSVSPSFTIPHSSLNLKAFPPTPTPVHQDAHFHYGHRSFPSTCLSSSFPFICLPTRCSPNTIHPSPHTQLTPSFYTSICLSIGHSFCSRNSQISALRKHQRVVAGKLPHQQY